MHGQYPSRIKEAGVDYKQTDERWAEGDRSEAGTEDLLIAAQDKSLATRMYHHRIIKDGANCERLSCVKEVGVSSSSPLMRIGGKS